jgi:hypothetical protein
LHIERADDTKEVDYQSTVVPDWFRGMVREASCSANLAVSLHHDVVDVCLQRHADVLPLLRVKLEDMQDTRHTHLEEDCLHNVEHMAGMNF